jgi:hypothetical protein
MIIMVFFFIKFLKPYKIFDIFLFLNWKFNCYERKEKGQHVT